jgi:hypothetical protein
MMGVHATETKYKGEILFKEQESLTVGICEEFNNHLDDLAGENTTVVNS